MSVCDLCKYEVEKTYTSNQTGELQLCYGCLGDALRKKRDGKVCEVCGKVLIHVDGDLAGDRCVDHLSTGDEE